MHIDKFTWGSGPKHGATTERTMAYMDFAAEHGFDGVLVEGWNVGWDGNWIANSELFSFTESYPDFDLKRVHEHSLSTGVKLIGHHETSGGISNYEAQMEDGFALYQKMGVEQIKTGYVAFGQNLKNRDEQGVMRYEFTDSQDVRINVNLFPVSGIMSVAMRYIIEATVKILITINKGASHDREYN